MNTETCCHLVPVDPPVQLPENQPGVETDWPHVLRPLQLCYHLLGDLVPVRRHCNQAGGGVEGEAGAQPGLGHHGHLAWQVEDPGLALPALHRQGEGVPGAGHVGEGGEGQGQPGGAVLLEEREEEGDGGERVGEEGGADGEGWR